MRKECFLLIACAMLAIASIPSVLCYPPAGSDYLDPTTATIELEIIGMFNETLIVKGSTNVSRSNPYDPGDGHMKIDTEIISMSLVGTSTYIGPITVVESPSKKSNGTVRQQNAGHDFPADSFFDVFVEIQTMLGPPVSVLHNDDPVVMSAIIYGIPPWNTTYTGPPTVLIPLKDQNGSVVGFIKHIFHEIGSPEDHNVAVTDITSSKTGCLPKETVGQGMTMRINVTVEDQGAFTETFYVTVYANNTQVGKTQVTLNAAEIKTLTFVWNTVGWTKGNYWINATADTVPLETDTADNKLDYGWTFLTLAGDVDGNRVVNIFDIVRMAGGYGSRRGQPKYDPNSDIDDNDVINIFDIVAAAGNYGKSW